MAGVQGLYWIFIVTASTGLVDHPVALKQFCSFLTPTPGDAAVYYYRTGAAAHALPIPPPRTPTHYLRWTSVHSPYLRARAAARGSAPPRTQHLHSYRTLHHAPCTLPWHVHTVGRTAGARTRQLLRLCCWTCTSTTYMPHCYLSLCLRGAPSCYALMRSRWFVQPTTTDGRCPLDTDR